MTIVVMVAVMTVMVVVVVLVFVTVSRGTPIFMVGKMKQRGSSKMMEP